VATPGRLETFKKEGRYEGLFKSQIAIVLAHGELLWSVIVRRLSSFVVRRASTFDVYTLETTFVIRFL